MATSGSIRITGHGYADLPAPVDLQPTASGVWTNTGLQLTLPTAGTYHLDANVRANLSVTDGTNAWIGARLWDVTAGVLVPDSQVLVYQLYAAVSPATTVVNQAGNQSAAILVPYTVPASRLIRLQVARIFTGPATTTARILSDANSRTTLRYERIA